MSIALFSTCLQMVFVVFIEVPSFELPQKRNIFLKNSNKHFQLAHSPEQQDIPLLSSKLVMLRFGSALLSCGGPGTFAWIRPMQNAGFLLLLLVQPATLWLQHWQQVDKQLLSLSHLFFSALFSAYLFSPFPRFVLLRAGFLLLLHLHFSFAATTTKATTKQLVFCMNVGLFVCASACVCVQHACA